MFSEITTENRRAPLRGPPRSFWSNGTGPEFCNVSRDITEKAWPPLSRAAKLQIRTELQFLDWHVDHGKKSDLGARGHRVGEQLCARVRADHQH